MGITERKERERELKRSMILEAAEAVILDKGLEHLNMDEVAEKAEVSKGSLYQYFNSKNDLVLGICNKASSLLDEKISKVLSKDIPVLDLVREIGATFMSFVNDHPEYFRAMRFKDNYKLENGAVESAYLEACQVNMKSSFTCMVRAIQIGIQDGSINPSFEPKQLAILLWGTSHGMVSLAYQHQNTQHFNLLDELGISLADMFDGYMEVIGSGIASDTWKKKDDC